MLQLPLMVWTELGYLIQPIILLQGSGSSAVSKVTAKQMNIYGGMRMGAVATTD
jgi:hypothetical protein